MRYGIPKMIYNLRSMFFKNKTMFKCNNLMCLSDIL